MTAIAVEAVRLLVWLAILAAVFVPLERLFPVRRRRVFRRQFAVDIAYYFGNSLLSATLLAVPLALVVAATHHLMPSTLLSFTRALPFWPKLGLSMLIAEVGFYWGHRLSHAIPWLWRFHAIHHSAEDVDFLTNTRAHPIDLVFARLCGFAPLYALGFGQAAAVPALVVVVATLWGYFVHANLKWRFGWLEWIIATPAFHHWHHTNDAHRDRNFAPLFPLLDTIFGTLHLPRAWPPVYGIDDTMPATLTGQLLHPMAPGRTAEPAAASAVPPAGA